MGAFLEELKTDAERNGHKSSVHFHGHPIVTVRPAAFKRCLANLVSNAARYAPSISITGQRDHRWLTVTVDDDGPGIAPHLREEVFKPFLRLDDARNQDEGGTGLGLAIARDIARSHGGDILLSDSPLGGLRATAWVPVSDRFLVGVVATAAPARAQAARGGGNPEQIVEKARPALSARERAVERGHGAGEAGIVIVHPGRNTCANKSASPCARSMPRGPAAPMSAAVSIHCCERTASPFKAKARPGLRAAERRSERTAALCGASSSSRRISTSNRRSRGGSAMSSSPPPASTARSMAFMCGEDGERRAEHVAQVGERDAGTLGDLGKTDLLDRLFGEQRHERVDDALALGLASVRGGPCGRFRRWFARHDGTPERIALALNACAARRSSRSPASSRERVVAAAMALVISGASPSFAISTSSAAAVVPPGDVTFCLSVAASSGER